MENLDSCPLCEKRNFSLFIKKEVNDKVFNILKCESCGLIFVNPIPSVKELSKYYNEEYSVQKWQVNKILNKAKKIKRILSKFNIPKDANILEVGASHGYFLNEMKKLGFNVYGVELSKVACENAKKIFNINIENKDLFFSSYAERNNFFDIIFLLDVLEHIPNQNDMLKLLHKLLKEDGLLVLTIPNAKSFEFKICGKYWEWMSPPAHLFYYTPETILKMLRKHNFSVIYIETYQGDSAGNLLFQIYLSLRKYLFFNLKYILGENKIKNLEKNIKTKRKNILERSEKEFYGLDYFVFILSKILWIPFLLFDVIRFKLGYGPSILVVARKK